MLKSFLGVASIPTLLGAAFAGRPTPNGIGFQEAATPVMEDVRFFHDTLLMPIITLITLLVLGLLIYVIVRYNRNANPTPAKFSHNTLVEVIWVGIPVLILAAIGFFSFPLLYKADAAPASDMTLKAVGNSWYWSFEYPDYDDHEIVSTLIPDEEIDESRGQIRLLSVDNPVIVPVGRIVRVLVTSNDVLHSFAMPAFGIKTDAVPGRLNETWFRADRTGDFYGQCSEICGVGHAYMPIHIKVVDQQEFDRWIEQESGVATKPRDTELAGAASPAETR